MQRAPVSRRDPRAGFPLRALSLKILLASAVASGALASEGQSQAPVPHARSTDDRLAVQVQTALANDPKLKPHALNLLINVVDGFAVIGGAVPSEDLLPRIRSVAMSVENIRGAKVSGWLATADKRDDPYALKIAEQLAEPKPKLEPLPPPVAAPSPSALPPLAIPAQAPPADPMPPPIPKEPAAGTTVVRRPPAPGGLFLDPVVSSGTPTATRKAPAPGAAPLPYPTIPPPGLPTTPAASSDAEPPKAADPRFAGLTATRVGGTATIAGRAAKLLDAWDFADAVGKRPGIDTVVVGAVKVK